MRAVDTNVLLRVIVRDDEKQAIAADAFIAKGAWISHVVLVETIWVLSRVYELGTANIAKVVEMLLHHESLSVQDSSVVAAALERYRERPALGFSDCLMLEIARKSGHLPLGTFDRAFSKQVGAERL